MELVTENNERILGCGLGPGKSPRIALYDFRRPDKFSKDQIRTISIMHETFARLSATSLSAMLRSIVSMHVAMVDQNDYGQFIESLPNPGFSYIVNLDPLKGSAVLAVSPNIVDACIDRLFGGKGAGEDPRREISDIGQSVMEGVGLPLFGNLREAFSTIIDLRPRLGQIETNPQFTMIVPPTEMSVVVTFDIALNETRGFLKLCYPYLTLEPIARKLCAQYWYTAMGKRSSGVQVDVARLKSDSSVYFGGEALSLSAIARLKPGDLIRIPDRDKAQAVLNTGNRDVLRLSLSKESKQGKYIFTVLKENEDNPAAGARVSELTGGKSEGAVPDAMTRIAEELKKGMKEMNDRIGNLAGQRDQENKNGEPGNTPELLDEMRKPFGFLRHPDADHLAAFLGMEHPQTIAFILSYLEPALSSLVFSSLPEGMHVDIARRIARMERTALAVLRETEMVLSRKFKALITDEGLRPKGTDVLGSLLSITNRGVEKKVMEALAREEPALAEKVKARYLTFEDLALLGKEAVRLLKSHVQQRDWVLALKGADQKVVSRVLSVFSPDEAERFNADSDAMGRVKLQNVEEAQSRIIQVIRELEETGEIEPRMAAE